MLKLERQECSRCFGLGRYGPSTVYGGRCFKCSGKGQVLTPAASKLSAELLEAKKVRFDSVQVGQVLIWDDALTGKRTKVIVREVGGEAEYSIRCSTDATPDYFYTYRGQPDSLLTLPWSDEQIQAWLEAKRFVGKRARKGIIEV